MTFLYIHTLQHEQYVLTSGTHAEGGHGEQLPPTSKKI